MIPPSVPTLERSMMIRWLIGYSLSSSTASNGVSDNLVFVRILFSIKSMLTSILLLSFSSHASLITLKSAFSVPIVTVSAIMSPFETSSGDRTPQLSIVLQYRESSLITGKLSPIPRIRLRSAAYTSAGRNLLTISTASDVSHTLLKSETGLYSSRLPRIAWTTMLLKISSTSMVLNIRHPSQYSITYKTDRTRSTPLLRPKF